MTTIQQKILQVVSQIPKGKVMTYGHVAKLAGTKSARLIGQTLHKNIDPEKIPCHRVVFKNGSLSKNYAFGGSKKQQEKLENEGVKFTKNKISLKQPVDSSIWLRYNHKSSRFG